MSRFSLLSVFLILCFAVISCRKSDALYTGSATLGFSKDLVYFDTVFTRLPGTNYPRSINKQFLVRNPYDKTIKTSVRLAGGSASEFRINVDGRPGTVFNDVEILAKDSMWVFVEASFDANNDIKPVLVRDSIAFETNGNTQFVKLQAYGWDAYYFNDSVIDANTVWTATDKPYVIVNTLFVDEGKTLTINPGIHIYSTPNSVYTASSGNKLNLSALNVLGTLKVMGTASNPVIFEGDRLENVEPYDYTNVPGQWRGLHFFVTSLDNEINYAVIKNATIGIWVDSLSNNGNTKLTIRKSLIKNCSSIGLLGLTASISAENTVISNCASNTFYGYLGGLYDFKHCTFNNYSSGGRRDPHLIISNILRDDRGNAVKTYLPIGFSIKNCIIWGPAESEIGFDVDDATPPSPSVIDHCFIKLKKPPLGTNNIHSGDPKFKDASKSDLHIIAGSAVIDKGISVGITDDFDDKSRDSNPDLGAFEL